MTDTTYVLLLVSVGLFSITIGWLIYCVAEGGIHSVILLVLLVAASIASTVAVSKLTRLETGIVGRITVYGEDGCTIASYYGEFDVSHGSDRVVFVDKNGKRHIIHCTTGNIVIDETGVR